MDEKTHYSDELQDLLSGRLSDTERIAVENHLEVCPLCRKEMEELRWSKQLLSSLPASEVPSDLQQRVGKMLDKEDRKMDRSKTIIKYAAVFILVTIGLFYFFRKADVASRVAADFGDFQSGKLRLQIYTNDETNMEAFFATHGITFRTRVFDLAMMKYDLVGGRIHELGKRKSAFFVYKDEANNFLVCQMYSGVPSDLPRAATLREHNGIHFYIYKRNGRTAVFWQEGEVLCVLVSDVPSEKVIELAFAKAMPAPAL